MLDWADVNKIRQVSERVEVWQQKFILRIFQLATVWHSQSRLFD